MLFPKITRKIHLIKKGVEISKSGEKFLNFKDLFEIFQKYIETNIINQGYGVLIPLEIHQSGDLSTFFIQNCLFGGYYIKNLKASE